MLIGESHQVHRSTGGEFNNLLIKKKENKWTCEYFKRNTRNGDLLWGGLIMSTYVYMIRHADSIFCLENEINRKLTLEGMKDASIVTELLLHEEINIIYSSPYRRAIQTVEELSIKLSLDIKLEEDLRESLWAGIDLEMSTLHEVIEKCFIEQDFSLSLQDVADDILSNIHAI